MDAQYIDARSLPSNTYINYILSEVGLFDGYRLYQTDQYEYQATIYKLNGERIQYTISRSGEYNTIYSVNETVGDDSYAITNELAVVSNMGDGTMYVPPAVTQMGCIAVMVISVILILKMVMFPVLNANRKIV